MIDDLFETNIFGKKKKTRKSTLIFEMIIYTLGFCWCIYSGFRYKHYDFFFVSLFFAGFVILRFMKLSKLIQAEKEFTDLMETSLDVDEDYEDCEDYYER